MHQSAHQQYWVSPIAGDWDVTRQNEVLSHHGRKRDAVNAAARLAQANQPSIVTIQRRDGSIETRRFYGKGPVASR
ncbi:DUF2188 domain-containing protein [Amycolatopsis sp. K13G38]|uniref:DUF2188 domain-containing protein n=2 Tax=Amycolatopsis acididurans TaxID=2724524 RepID=A0ABX1IXT7_9PSEU|nr:DUF2188 domain-containing protein [Amycolatopsis acididurans]